MWKHLSAAVLGVALVATQARPPVVIRRESDLRPLLLRPGVVSLLAKSQRPLLVDLLWLRTLNAIGEPDSERKNRALYDYAVFLSDVDPRLYQAYAYIGINVPSRRGRGWVNADLADDLFGRGLKQFPTDLRLMLFRAGNYYLGLRDFVRASDTYLAASRLPDAPHYLAPLAVRLRAHQDPRGAIEFTTALLAQTIDADVRKDLEQKLHDLQVEEQLQEIDRAIAAYQSKWGQRPARIEDLRMAGFDIPATDIYGGELRIKDGSAYSSSLEKRVKLFYDPNDDSD